MATVLLEHVFAILGSLEPPVTQVTQKFFCFIILLQHLCCKHVLNFFCIVLFFFVPLGFQLTLIAQHTTTALLMVIVKTEIAIVSLVSAEMIAAKVCLFTHWAQGHFLFTTIFLILNSQLATPVVLVMLDAMPTRVMVVVSTALVCARRANMMELAAKFVSTESRTTRMIPLITMAPDCTSLFMR
jgi:hypothetical protein